MNDNHFKTLATVDVSKHLEKKGKYSYLSWPFAVQQLKLQDPNATWTVTKWDGIPFLKTETGYFVEVSVTANGVTMTQIHPVLDGRNDPIVKPSSFEINTSIQRCLVKAIALHGLGLSIYAGEDLWNLDEDASKPDEILKLLQDASANGMEALQAAWRDLAKRFTDTGERDKFWAQHSASLKQKAQ